MKYKLVAVDMDGTLLTPKLEISKATIEAVARAIEMGTVFTLSTGRMYLAALPFAGMLQLDVPLITCNGALTRCAKSGKVYDIKIIPDSICREISEYCNINNLSLSVYSDDDIFIRIDSDNIEIHDYMDHAKPQVVNDLDTIFNRSVIKLLINSRDKKSLEYHSRALSEKYGNELGLYFSLPYFTEIVHKDANKRNALEKVASIYNIRQEEIIAIGDNYNDLEMIKFAGLGVAMGNSPQYLKNEADFITHSNDEDGVRYIIEKFILDSEVEVE